MKECDKPKTPYKQQTSYDIYIYIYIYIYMYLLIMLDTLLLRPSIHFTQHTIYDQHCGLVVRVSHY
jgi:hypothetical protein